MNFKQIVFGVFILSAVSCSEENIESNSDIINKSTDLGSLTYRIEYNGGFFFLLCYCNSMLGLNN